MKKQKKNNPDKSVSAGSHAKASKKLPKNVEPKNIYAASAGNPGADAYQWGK